MPLPVSVPVSLFDLIAVPLSLLLHFIPLCGAIVFFVLALSSYLGCLALLIYVQYIVAFLALLRVLYVVVLVYFAFVSRFFPPESLPGDAVLCRLLPRPLPSVYFLPSCLFVSFLSWLLRPCSSPICFGVTPLFCDHSWIRSGLVNNVR